MKIQEIGHRAQADAVDQVVAERPAQHQSDDHRQAGLGRLPAKDDEDRDEHHREQHQQPTTRRRVGPEQAEADAGIVDEAQAEEGQHLDRRPVGQVEHI